MKTDIRAPISVRAQRFFGSIDVAREGATWHTAHSSRLRLF